MTLEASVHAAVARECCDPVVASVIRSAHESNAVRERAQSIADQIPDLVGQRSGQPVKISIDAFPDQTLQGKVDSIQSGTGAFFSAFPPQNATGNFVKIVQRVPVKIIFQPPPATSLALGPGMSVVPTVDIRAAGTAPASVPVQASQSR